ncbi:hypothetical protein SS50377_21153 [Spironucleus salmonicida]|uniref:Uncharacterized protein n=1 Tax=Spironucleus salmonicida TaxID=348837 RepID=V6LT13_9EUKA|nr:hypothetical protein SS50377_21153 [Spironucleus salmonicida]|eukprot:EST43934.1 Hypothetical protein SS50377_16237 [Spironucleus salmonicida]
MSSTKIFISQLPKIVVNTYPKSISDKWGIEQVSQEFTQVYSVFKAYQNIQLFLKVEHQFQATISCQVQVKLKNQVIYNTMLDSKQIFKILLAECGEHIVCDVKFIQGNQILDEKQFTIEVIQPYTVQYDNNIVQITSNLDLPILVQQEQQSFNFMLGKRKDKMNLENQNYKLYTSYNTQIGQIFEKKLDFKTFTCQVNQIIKLEVTGDSIQKSQIQGLDFVDYSSGILFLFTRKTGIYKLNNYIVTNGSKQYHLDNLVINVI